LIVHYHKGGAGGDGDVRGGVRGVATSHNPTETSVAFRLARNCRIRVRVRVRVRSPGTAEL